MKRRIDWTAHAKALRKGQKAVAQAAPSPQQIDATAGRHDAMQLAAWGVPWPPPKGWKDKLADLYREQQDAKGKSAEAKAEGPGAALACRTKAELVAELVDCQETIWKQLERIARLTRETMGSGDAETPDRFTAAQIRRGGMEYERQTAVEWLRDAGKQALAAAMERGEHHGARKRA